MIFDATMISLKVVITSVIITLLISIIMVMIISRRDSKINTFIETLITLPMFIPPSAIGYLILISVGKNSFIGKILKDNFNVSIIFTLSAAVIAAVVVTIPIMYQSIKASVKSVDKNLINAAKIFGADDFTTFIKIVLPLSRRGIYNGIILSFARAFGEFGATILVAGNIPGKTQTLPMAMYYAIENNNNAEATKILIIVFVVAIFLMTIYKFFTTKISS